MTLAADNLSLIGMPGSGKSTVGRLLANRLGWRLIDVDDVIKQRHGVTVLGDVLTRLGREAFLDAEADAVCSLDGPGVVAAPGGSVVYRERAMAHLRQLGPIVYLELSLDELAPRLGDLVARGVAGNEGGLPALFAERAPLYARFATHAVSAAGDSAQAVADRVIRALPAAG